MSSLEICACFVLFSVYLCFIFIYIYAFTFILQNKALCDSWAPHGAGRTEYGVPNDDVENVEQQSIYILDMHGAVARSHREPCAAVFIQPGHAWTVFLRSLHRRLGHHTQSFLHGAVP